MAFQVALVVKNPPAHVRDMRLRFNPWVKKIPWKRAWWSTSVFLRIPWTEEPDRLQSIGSQRVGHDWSDSALTDQVSTNQSVPVNQCKYKAGFHSLSTTDTVGNIFVAGGWLVHCSIHPTTQQWYPLP